MSSTAQIQGLILDRLGHVCRSDFRVTAEVGDSAGDLQQAVVGAGGESELLDGGAEKRLD